MEVALAVGLAVTSASLALVVLWLGRAFVNAAAASIKRDELNRKLLTEQDEFTFKTLVGMQNEMVGMAKNQHALRMVKERGLSAFMMDADSVVKAEIRAFAENLHCSEAEAARYMKSRIPDPVPTETVNGQR